MDKILKIKLFFIGFFVIASIYFFYDELFSYKTQELHYFGEIAFLVASVSFGVIIAASIYNLSFYFYMKNKQYLYYALAQFSILIFLINLDSLFISPFSHIFGFNSIRMLCISAVSILLFSLLFINEFLKDYKVHNVKKVINKVLWVVWLDLFISLIFSISFFISFLFLFIWLVLSEANREIKEKDLPFYFLLTGWYIVIFVAAIEHLGLLELTGITFPFLHVSFAIESVFLSLAIAYKFKLTEEQQKMQQVLLLQQARLASMGEMISTIAHQWRQPLNNLAVVQMNLNRRHKEDKESKMLLDEANHQIKYMSQTIETFRNFYNPSKQREEFLVEESIENTLKILDFTFQKEKITVLIKIEDEKKLYGNKNEFEQVLLNILNNAKDVLLADKISKPVIEIELDAKKLSIKDNGRGIPLEYQDRVFNPYFSTKGSDGIGLYLSKIIIEQEFSAILKFTTNSKGTEFTISL